MLKGHDEFELNLDDVQTYRARTFLLILMVALSVMTTDLYLASFKDLKLYFSASTLQLQLSQSAYLAGFAISSIPCALFSERFGTKKVLLASFALYILGTSCALFADKIELFILGRFFQSFGGGASSILSRAIVRSKYQTRATASILSWMFFAVACTLLIAPLLGAGLQHLYGWKGNFLFMLSLGSSYLVASYVLLEESPLTPSALPFHSIFNYSDYLFYTLFTAITWAGFMSFVGFSPFMISFYFEKPPLVFGTLYALMMLFFIVGNRYSQSSLLLGISSVFLGTLALMAAGLWSSLCLYIASGCLFLFGSGRALPYLQLKAISSLPGMANHGFAFMYFSMMLLSALCGILMAQNISNPFTAAQIISGLGICQVLLYFRANK